MNTDSDSLDKLKNQPDFFSSYIGEIWYQGDLSLLNLPKVSIVGTREISEEGMARTRRLTTALVEKGLCIVSGLAAGVDTIAHQTALDQKGKTIAVMGTPINQCFPKENAPLKERIMREGLLLSQFNPGRPVHKGNFPKRNEFMARISAVTFVVEAQERSGTRHQVSASVGMGKKIGFLNSLADQNYPWVTSALQTGHGVVIRSVKDALELLDQIGATTRPAQKRRADRSSRRNVLRELLVAAVDHKQPPPISKEETLRFIAELSERGILAHATYRLRYGMDVLAHFSIQKPTHDVAAEIAKILRS